MAQKQKQHRTGTRAPHGAPQFTERIAIYATRKQKRAFRRLGGSQWLRDVIDQALVRGET